MAPAISESVQHWFGEAPSHCVDGSSEPVPRPLLWMLLALVVLAAWLRLSHLGQIGLDRDNDEDIMAVAVLGILEHGYPLMPSGMIYLRSAPLLYLMAGATELFGVNEFALRLVPALFGVLLVPLVFVVARRCFGAQVALLAAALVALSLWQVEVTRLARMYAPFAFTYLLALYAICRGFLDGHRGWRIASLPLAALTIPIHTLGFTLCAAFGIAAMHSRRTPRVSLLAVAGLISTAAAFILWGDLQSQAFNRAITMAESRTLAAEPVDEKGIAQAFAEKVIKTVYLPPEFPAGSRVSTAAAVVAALVTLIVFLQLRRRWPESRAPLSSTILAAALIAAVLHQMLLAALLLLALVFVRPTERMAWVVYVAVVIVAIGIAWLGLGLLGSSTGQATLREVLRSLADYPRFEVLRPFVAGRPVLAAMALLGAYLTARSAVHRRDLTPGAFLLATGVSALMLHGILESQFRPRYNFNLDALFLIFAATGIVAIGRWATRRLTTASNRDRPPVATLDLTVVGLLTLVALSDQRTVAAFAYPLYWEGMPTNQVERHGFPPAVDRRSPALYVAEHKSPTDEVMTMDWFTTYFYAGRVDYLLRSGQFDWGLYEEGGRQRDAYLGSVIVPDPKSLRRRVGDPCQPTLWIVTSSRALAARQKTSAEIVAYMDGLEAMRVYSGLDGVSSVYRVPPVGDCPMR